MQANPGQNNSGPRTFRLGASIANLAAAAERRSRYIRVMRATVVMLLVLAVGTYGFWYFTAGERTIIECLYMTVLTVSTVGFSETIPVVDDSMRAFTIGLILFGGGSIIYFLTAITAVIVEGDLLYRWWAQRVRRRLDAQEDHIIVAGVGRSGIRAAYELGHSRSTTVVVDHSSEQIEEALPTLGTDQLFLVGDALEEETLVAAGIKRAKGLIAAIGDDRDNLLLSVTARQLNPNLRIVSEVRDIANCPKLSKVGVHAVVNPATLGGRRLANEFLRPEVLSFTDAMLSSAAHRLSLEQVDISPGAPCAGKSLEEARLAERSGALILGLRYMAEGPFRYDPAADSELVAGGGIIALGDRRQRRRLRKLLRGPKRGRMPGPLKRLPLPGGRP